MFPCKNRLRRSLVILIFLTARDGKASGTPEHAQKLASHVRRQMVNLLAGKLEVCCLFQKITLVSKSKCYLQVSHSLLCNSIKTTIEHMAGQHVNQLV